MAGDLYYQDAGYCDVRYLLAVLHPLLHHNVPRQHKILACASALLASLKIFNVSNTAATT